MPIYRGVGGSGDASTDAYASQVAESANTATIKANESAASAAKAAASAAAAAASESLVDANRVATQAAAAAAATSESNAATSASTATTQANNATTARVAAEAAELAASGHSVTAQGYATDALNFRNDADTAATNASASASAASASATLAGTHATNASTSASNAATSESNAATSETNAANSAAAAQAALDAMEGVYLGAQASNPTVDLNGDPVTAGDWYYNTTSNQSRVYNGSTWDTLSPDLVGDSTPQLGGNLDLNTYSITGTGGINITGSISATGYNNANWDTAYTYSQVGHLPLAGGTLTGALDVTGSITADNAINLEASSGYAAIEMGGPSGAFIDFKAPFSDDFDGRIQYDNASGGFLFFNGSERMRITSAGNVGIGTSSPAEKLHVASGGAEYALQWNNDTSNNWVLASAANRAYITNKTTTNEVLTILNGGNVGIGTSSPSTKLDVAGVSRYTFDVANAYTLETSLNAAGSAFSTSYKNALDHIWQTSGAERMRINSAGNVTLRGSRTYLGKDGATRHWFATADAIGEPNSLAYAFQSDGSAVNAHIWRAGNVEKLRLDVDGLKFNGDSAAANALDDYEEGTFTPYPYGTTTPGTWTNTGSSGFYTKVGNRVFFTLRIVGSLASATGAFTFIGGMPFTVASGSGHYAGGQIAPYFNGFSLGSNQDLVWWAEGGTSALVIGIAGTSTTGGLDAATASTTLDMRISGSYQV